MSKEQQFAFTVEPSAYQLTLDAVYPGEPATNAKLAEAFKRGAAAEVAEAVRVALVDIRERAEARYSEGGSVTGMFNGFVKVELDEAIATLTPPTSDQGGAGFDPSEVTLCAGCNCMTHTVDGHCGKCGAGEAEVAE